MLQSLAYDESHFLQKQYLHKYHWSRDTGNRMFKQTGCSLPDFFEKIKKKLTKSRVPENKKVIFAVT